MKNNSRRNFIRSWDYKTMQL